MIYIPLNFTGILTLTNSHVDWTEFRGQNRFCRYLTTFVVDENFRAAGAVIFLIANLNAFVEPYLKPCYVFWKKQNLREDGECARTDGGVFWILKFSEKNALVWKDFPGWNECWT